MKKKVTIVVGICSCVRMREKRDAVRETWLRHPAEGVECVFFVGGREGGEGKELEGEQADTVELAAPDGYNELPCKVRAFFRHALENYDFDWLFKCDDDTYLDLGRLSTLIDPEYDLVGDKLVSIRHAPSGGAGYLLKREMVEKLVDEAGFPESGAEDLIVGELVARLGGKLKSTGRLYMSNVYYPSVDNDMVTAHWCTPSIMRALYTINHSRAAVVGDASHPHWKDELHFYADGVFTRRDSSCYGWWSIGPKGELALKWQMWPLEQLLLKGNVYVGSQTVIQFPAGMMTLEQLQNAHGNNPDFPNSSRLYIHLGCGDQRLSGWLNLDAPNYPISRRLPWDDDLVEAYYLGHLIDAATSAEACGFFFEAFRSLKPGGILRLAFRDVLSLAGSVTPSFRQYMKTKYPDMVIPVNEVGALLAFYKQKSLWTADLLTEILKSAGFEVVVLSPGESHHAHLQLLERRSDRDEHPFELLGIVCVEAKKPLRGTQSKSLASGSHAFSTEKRDDYVAPYFKDCSRTGNHLFQIAAVYAHALRHGLECRIPWERREETKNLRAFLGESCSCCPDGGYEFPVIYKEPCFSYCAIPGTVRGGAVEGYFQSEKYFEEYGGEIRALFGNLISPTQEGTAGVHLRMGDYLTLDSLYHTPDVPFLDEALKRLSGSIKKLVVFSDSPELARKLMENVPEARRFEMVMDKHGTLDALRELTAMQELVLSCSSFSWWGAYLGDQDKVFIQKEWFTGKITDYQDVYRNKWIRI